MADFLFSVVENCFLLVHTKKAPTNAEWDQYLAELGRRADRIEDLRSLVFTDGGGPTSEQRGRLNPILKGRASRAAVVSNAPIIRFIVSSLALLNPKIRTFQPEELSQALAHIELPIDILPTVRKQLLGMLEEMGKERVLSLSRALTIKSGSG